MDLEQFPLSKSAKRMLSYVTKGWYDRSYIGKWIYEVMGRELDGAGETVLELPYQLFPETATWGLRYHELKWGLPVREDLSHEERRRLIFRKRDEHAPINPYRMEVILKNMTGREARVDDESGPPNTFTVEFGPGDGAVDLAGVIRHLEEIKQSHVTFSVNLVSMPPGPAQVSAGAWQQSWSKPAALGDDFQIVDGPVRSYLRAWLEVQKEYRRRTITEQEVQDAAVIQ